MHLRSFVTDSAFIGALGSSPWWALHLDLAAHVALVGIALGIGALRLMIVWREWRRSRRWR